jgi:hypothetical protein
VVQPILNELAKKETVAGAKPVGTALVGNFGTNTTLETQVQLQPNKCYSVVATSLPPVSEVNVQLVAVAADGLPDFDALQRAMRGGRNAPRLLYQVFDVLRAGGRDLLHVELAERKRILAELIGPDGDGTLRYVEHHVGSGPALHARAHALGIEGIVSKRVRSGYRPGVRTRAWVKVKCYRVYRVTVARVRDGEVAVLDGEGAPAGWVPVYSRLQLAALHPGDAITVKALARRPGRHLRHATIVDEDM